MKNFKNTKLGKVNSFVTNISNEIDNLNNHPLKWLVNKLEILEESDNDKKGVLKDRFKKEIESIETKKLREKITDEAINAIVKKDFQKIIDDKDIDSMIDYLNDICNNDTLLCKVFLNEYYAEVKSKKYLNHEKLKELRKFFDKVIDKLYKQHFSLLDGSEEVKFKEPSTIFAEKYDLYFDKDDMRQIKTIAYNLSQLPFNVNIKRITWDTFEIRYKDKLLMKLRINNDKYVSDEFQNNAYEEHQRLYKVNDVKEMIDYIVNNTDNVLYIQNKTFSIMDWMYEHRLEPYKLFHLRVIQTINYCRQYRIPSVRTNENVKSYIKSYLDTMFQRSLKNPDEFNFIQDMKIFFYVNPGKYSRFRVLFDLVINRLKGIKVMSDTPPYVLVDKMYREYLNIVDCIYEYIDKQIRGEH